MVLTRRHTEGGTRPQGSGWLRGGWGQEGIGVRDQDFAAGPDWTVLWFLSWLVFSRQDNSSVSLPLQPFRAPWGQWGAHPRERALPAWCWHADAGLTATAAGHRRSGAPAPAGRLGTQAASCRSCLQEDSGYKRHRPRGETQELRVPKPRAPAPSLALGKDRKASRGGGRFWPKQGAGFGRARTGGGRPGEARHSYGRDLRDWSVGGAGFLWWPWVGSGGKA